jgi:hypothetical protein
MTANIDNQRIVTHWKRGGSPSGTSTLPAAYILALAALTVTPVVIGKLPLLTIACAAVFPFLLPRIVANKRLLWLSAVLALWAGGQALADVGNGGAITANVQMVTASAVLVMAPVLALAAGGDKVRARHTVTGVASGLFISSLLLSQMSPASAAAWKYGLTQRSLSGVRTAGAEG